MFDADGDKARPEHRIKHERDNRALISLLAAAHAPFPATNVFGGNHAIWSTNLTEVVKSDFGANYQRITDPVRVNYAQEGGLAKNDLFIADWLTAARPEGLESATLSQLCQTILAHARAA